MKPLSLILTAGLPISALAANIDIQPIPDLPLNNVPSVPLAKKAPAAGVWHFSLGGGVSYAPRYEGAARDRLRFIPLLEASYNNDKFFISLLRGMGYNFSDEKDMQYGVRLMPGHGRRESADPRLGGMGNIRYVPEAGLFFNQRIAPWYVSAGITTGSHGIHTELGGGFGLPLSHANRMRLGANLNWGDSRYNQTYFGVTAAQAAASGNVLTPYNASSGVKDFALTANWIHNFDNNWFSNAGLSYKWLMGSARQSPLTERGAAGSVNFLLGYRF